jgi:hypothetical protein
VSTFLENKILNPNLDGFLTCSIKYSCSWFYVDLEANYEHSFVRNLTWKFDFFCCEMIKFGTHFLHFDLENILLSSYLLH